MTYRVLIGDDESNIRRMLRAVLEQQSHEVRDAPDGNAVLRVADEFEPHLVLLDLVMPPGPDGLTTLERLRERYPDLVVIMMSGKASLADAVQATRLGAVQFLEKPLSADGVTVAVNAGLELVDAWAENRALRAAADHAPVDIVGESPAIVAVRAAIAQVANAPSRVLITGESGTGKELVARAIHEASPRRTRPLIAVNCAAIPRDLVESELFGHERGAFTGATRRHPGKFELAHRGTLFLDEVGDLDPGAQAKLLRVLETGTVERVGGERGVPVDVRVIAATNQDLERAIATGSFREDLFYRLNVFPIEIPPLRNRPGDVPRLVHHLAARSATRCGRPEPRFEPDALDRLAAHSWPGNVRELANIVERLTIVADRGRVTARTVGASLGIRAAPSARSTVPRAGLTGALDQYERDLIRGALTDAAGNVAEAARRLRTDRANLYRRMRRLGIGPKDTPVSD